MDSNMKNDTTDIIEGAIPSKELDRRSALKQMMLGALGVAASSSLTACLGDGTPQSLTFNPSSVGGDTPLGSFENPLTQENSGNFSSGKTLRQVGVFSSQVNASTSTPIHGLWVEVMDPSSAPAILTSGTTTFTGFADEDLHPMSASEFVAEIRLVNKDTGSILAAATFAAGEAPRMMLDTSLEGITTIQAYARIDGAGGWWMSEYSVADLQYAHDTTKYGSMRQPLTRNQAGKFSTDNETKQKKVYGHSGSTKIKALTAVTAEAANHQITRIVFGDHDGVRSHPRFGNDHYFLGGYFLDQRGQPIKNATYTWGSDVSGSETGTTGDDGRVAELKGDAESTSTSAGAAGSGSSASTNGQEAAGVIFLDVELPDYVTDFRFVWLCTYDGWWHIRGNTALIQG